jgi:Ser/Thr protein kinase RdoA (MazF antagonist)
MLLSILDRFGIKEADTIVTPFGSGLINNTWQVHTGKGDYILQRINHAIFKNPADIAFNIKCVADYLAKHHPYYFFVKPQPSLLQEDMIYIPEQGYFRLFPFVKGSHTIDVVSTTQQAIEASTQFGQFAKLLSGFAVNELKVILPHFHDLTLRYQQFEAALLDGNPSRIEDAKGAIDFLKAQHTIAITYNEICNNSKFKKRVTHHDTKISNVLLNSDDKGLCVIDLDTIMPGYFISDVGDMFRTYLSPVSEEEKDFNKIIVREEYFEAIAIGYLSQMKDELTQLEKVHFIYAGKFMIYMQALRFLTDYINDDIYYGAKYEGHNFLRAQNQIVLLQRLLEKETVLQKIVDRLV